MNRVTLIGFVGKDPEAKQISNGKKVANISLATSRSYKDINGTRQTKTEWHRLNAFSPLAEIFEKYIKKGSQIAVVGELQTRSYDDNSGVKRYVTEILVRELEMLGKQSNSNETNNNNAHMEHVSNGEENELPF